MFLKTEILVNFGALFSLSLWSHVIINAEWTLNPKQIQRDLVYKDKQDFCSGKYCLVYVL